MALMAVVLCQAARARTSTRIILEYAHVLVSNGRSRTTYWCSL